jgi:hypothetical protein
MPSGPAGRPTGSTTPVKRKGRRMSDKTSERNIHQIDLEIGPGLFTDEPVEVPIQFPNCVAVFLLRPMTASVVKTLEGEGVDFSGDAVKTATGAVDRATRVLEELVHGWRDLIDTSGAEVPYTEANRDKMGGAVPLVKEVFRICGELAVKRVKAESKNSDS